jgi:hypothetical protein
MPDHHIQLFGGSRGIMRAVKRALASVGYEVTDCRSDRSLLESQLAKPTDMVILDADIDLEELGWAFEQLRARPEVILLMVSSELGRRGVDRILDRGLNNIVAKRGGITASMDLVDETEMIATVEKLLSRDIFGLDKYLPSRSIQVHSREIERSDQRDGALEQLKGFLAAIDCFQSIQPMILAVADELLMNAIFSAPRDQQGLAKYDSLGRHTAFALEPNELVGFEYACDGRNVLLSVSDRFGSLDRDTIVKYLGDGRAGGRSAIEYRKADHEQGGAGLGLYMVAHSITQLVFNIHKGVRTEVIASFYIRDGLRGFRVSAQSLNLFMLQ